MSHVKALAYAFLGHGQAWKLDQPRILAAISNSGAWAEYLGAVASWQATLRCKKQARFDACLMRASTLLTQADGQEMAQHEIEMAVCLSKDATLDAETASQKYFHALWKELKYVD